MTGRLKDVMVRKGEPISAKEVEDLLSTHPKVTEVAVVELSDPTGTLTLAEIAAFCRQAAMMVQEIPEHLETRTDWPRAGTGKVAKRELRADYS